MRNRTRVTRASRSNILSSRFPDGSTLNRAAPSTGRRRVSREFPRASRRATGKVS